MSLGQAVRFGVVGLLNTLVGLAAIYSLKLFADSGDVAANMSGYAVGMAVSFGLNRGWTFGHQGTRAKALPRFLATMAISYGMNVLTVLGAIHVFGVNDYLAQALGVAPFTITSFLLCKYWVFRTHSPHHAAIWTRSS